jgi:hypothetical protein
MGTRSRAAGARIRPLVASRARHDDHQLVGHTEHGEGRSEPGASPRRKVWKQAARVGPAPPAPRAGARSRRGAADGAGAAAGARSVARLRLCQRRDVVERSVLIGLAVVPRSEQEALERIRRRVGREEGDRNPGRACRSRKAAASPPGIQGGCAARHRHQSLGGRSLLVRLVLGSGRVDSVRRDRSVQPEESQLAEARRHRQA